MDELWQVVVLMGGILAVAGAALLVAPGALRRGLAALPRSAAVGRILAAVDLAWAAWLLFHTPLGRFEHLKPLIYILTPVSYLAVIGYMEDLLAARALGGFLLLAPAPVLAVARWHPSGWRLVVVVLCYAMAVAGIALVLSPYLLRKWLSRLVRDEGACRVCGFVVVLMGGCLLFLGASVF